MTTNLSGRPIRSFTLLVTLAASVLADRPKLRADEGMWTFDNPPLALLKERFMPATGSTRKRTPLDLPARVAAGREKLDLSTPLDFVTTNDITGGNSGSPVVNRQGELVGLIFDGNIESLVGRFVYSEETNRAVAVHSAAIIEALKKLYDAGALGNEMTGAPAATSPATEPASTWRS